MACPQERRVVEQPTRVGARARRLPRARAGNVALLPTANARPQAAPAGNGGQREDLSAPGTLASAGVILTAECPVVAYRQGAARCAAYGFASAVHEYCGHACARGCVRDVRVATVSGVCMCGSTLS